MLKPFDEVFEDRTKYGTKIKTDDYHSSGAHIIIDQGQEQIAGYTNLEEGLFTEVPAIIFGDHTRIIKYVDRPFFLGADGVKVLRCRYKDANYKYLYYALKSVHIPNTGYNRHFKWLKEATIFYPDRKTQAKIVETLEKASVIIEKRQQQLSALDDLIKARFVEMFGERGKQVPLKDYVWFQEGPGVRSVDFTSDGTILLTGSNINDNKITFGYKSDRFISNELANGKYSHFICDVDDILVVSSAIDPSKFDKKVTIVREDKKYCLNTGIIRFKPKKEYLTLGYFREFLKTDYFKHQVMEEMRGIAQMHFGPSHLKEMTILLPESLGDQVEFERFVSQIDKSKSVIQKSLDETQLLFDSLMQKYFG